MDMKEIITEAARKLVLEKKVKKLTVKDIVEECQITRQAFYYHFEGIPDMIQWSIKQGTRRLLEACKEQIKDRLFLKDCGAVECAEELQGILRLQSDGVGAFSGEKAAQGAENSTGEADGKVTKISAMKYVM